MYVAVRQVAVYRIDLSPHGVRERLRRHRSLQQKAHAASGPLPVRQVDLRRVRFVQAGILDVTDDADDFPAGPGLVLPPAPTQGDSFADGILVGEVLPGCRLRDQDHLRRSPAIGVAEEAAAL